MNQYENALNWQLVKRGAISGLESSRFGTLMLKLWGRVISLLLLQERPRLASAVLSFNGKNSTQENKKSVVK
jgi:hypothetical protein